jgi:hypothetical protein
MGMNTLMRKSEIRNPKSETDGRENVSRAANKLDRWCLGLLGVLVWLGLGVACHSSKPPHPASRPGGGRTSQVQVAEVHGSGCRGKNPGGSWHPLQPGAWLAEGALVEARPPSRIKLRFYQAGILVEVKPGTLLQLEKLRCRQEPTAFVTSTVLDLQQGQVQVDNANLSPGSEFEIRTPQGVTRIPPAPVK